MTTQLPKSERSLVQRISEKYGKEDALKHLMKIFPGENIETIPYLWELNARPKQLCPVGEWMYWFIKCGRRWGKTRAGAEFVRSEVESGRAKNICIVSETAHDARAVMVEGQSGIIGVSPPWAKPKYEASKRLLTWTNNKTGEVIAKAEVCSGETPDQIRGYGFDLVWGDEPAKWKRLEEAWDQLMFASAKRFKWIITTTPRPLKILMDLFERAKTDSLVRITEGALQENIANLSPAAIDEIMRKHDGTRLGRQEIYGKFLDDNPDAQWRQSWLDKNRVTQAAPLTYVVVFVDPSVSNTDSSDEMGIVVVGLGNDNHHYILADCTVRGTPLERSAAAATAFNLFRADKMCFESNQGGDCVGQLLAQACPLEPIEGVPASKGKRIRAEPVSALHERGVAHMVGTFPELEDQLCDWVPGDKAGSPDRLDAMVGAQIHLIAVAGQPPSETYDLLDYVERESLFGM